MADMNHTRIPNLVIDSLEDSSGGSTPSLQIGSGAQFLSKATSGSYTSLTLGDGELTIGSVSATSCRLVFRSGNTTYEFWANRAAIL